VYIEPAYARAGGVLVYVGRYIRRGPLSERRVRAYDGRTVTIAYAHPAKHARASFTLAARTFILRLVSHVPARGTHVARAFGLYHPRCRPSLDAARALCGQGPYDPASVPDGVGALMRRMFPDFTGDHCPRCVTRHAEWEKRTKRWEKGDNGGRKMVSPTIREKWRTARSWRT